jgi:hypothetical protein
MSTLIRSGGAIRMMLVAIVLLASTVTACGDDADDGKAAHAAARPAQAPPPLPPPPPSSRNVAARWSRERSGIGLYPNAAGMLVKPDGTRIRGWGNQRVRRYVTVLFARMQYDFLAGSMAPVCKHVVPLRSFLPVGATLNMSCAEKLKAYAHTLGKQGFRSSPLRLLWVRVYPGIAGIWVEDSRGKRFRVPFLEQGKRSWRLDLERLVPTGALGMPLRVRAAG